MTLKKWIFKFIYMENQVYHLKALKKLYRRHSNGSYRFLTGKSENRSSKLWKTRVLFINSLFFTTLSNDFHYFWWEINTLRLNVFCITFCELPNGTHGFPYKWIWKSRFFKSRPEPCNRKLITHALRIRHHPNLSLWMNIFLIPQRISVPSETLVL